MLASQKRREAEQMQAAQPVTVSPIVTPALPRPTGAIPKCCAKCKKTDHQRSNSKLCPENPKIKQHKTEKTNLPMLKDSELDFTAVVCSLKTFIRPEAKYRYLPELVNHVKMNSQWMIELFANFYWQHILKSQNPKSSQEYFNKLSTNGLRSLLYSVQGKYKKFPLPDAYLVMRRRAGLPVYGECDRLHRKSSEQRSIDLFKQNLEEHQLDEFQSDVL